MQAAGALRGVKVQRITFTEVTQQAVQQALAAPRSVSQELVDAYLGRRALDYLYGFTLSPLLWKKLPGSKSAGDKTLDLSANFPAQVTTLAGGHQQACYISHCAG